MAWLGFGAFLLLLAIFADRGRRLDIVSSVALVLLVGAAVTACLVYPLTTILLLYVGAFCGAWVIARASAWRRRRDWRAGALAAGLASVAFAVFGPSEGLF